MIKSSKIFTMHPSQPFLKIIGEHLLSQKFNDISKVTVIVPKEDDAINLKNILQSLSSTFPKIIVFENIDKEFLLLNMYDIKIIKPMKRLFLMMKFISAWNKENNENYPLSFSYDLLNFLNDMHSNEIPFSALHDLSKEDFSEQWQKTLNFLCILAEKWKLSLHKEGLLDILEYRSLYIDNLIKSWQENVPNDVIIFVGIVFSKSAIRFLRALYQLPNSQIILPFINLEITDKSWQSLNEDHSQYHFKILLDELSINRNEITLLGAKKINFFVESLFNFDEFLQYFHTSEDKFIPQPSNIQLVLCDSDNEEAEAITRIVTEQTLEDSSLFIESNLLLKRVNAMIKINTMKEVHDNDYLTVTFFFYVLDVVISNYGVVELLSLLKHPFVRLDYSEKDYANFLMKFELQIVRFNQSNHFEPISYNIKSDNDSELLIFWHKIESAINLLVNAHNNTIYDIFNAHIACLDALSYFEFSFSEKFNNFIDDFKDSAITLYGLNIYKELLHSTLYNYFLINNNRLLDISLIEQKAVLIANFNDGYYPSNLANSCLNNLMRKKIGLATFDELKGYFSLIMYSFFYTEKVYLTRSLKSLGKINEEHILIKRLNVLYQLYGSQYEMYVKSVTAEPINKKPCERPRANVAMSAKLKAFNMLSTTAIEQLINDPYGFYVRYILKIIPLKEIIEQPTSKNFGTIVHKALEHYVSCYKNIMHTSQECYNCLVEIARSYFFAISNNYPYVEAIWIPKFKKIAEQFSAIHTERTKNIIDIEVEKNFYWPISHDITIMVKCDRVEYFADNTVAIIDYKTGSLPSQVDIENGFAPQVIVQALAVEYVTHKKVRELIYWRLPDDIQIYCIKNHCEIMSKTKENLRKFLSLYLYTDISFTVPYDVDKNAKYTNYYLLERVGEWQLPINIVE